MVRFPISRRASGPKPNPAGFLEATTRAWLIAALLVYVASASALQATPLHAFQGTTIPLAVLAVDGLRRVGWSRMPHHALAAVVKKLQGRRVIFLHLPWHPARAGSWVRCHRTL